MILFMQQKIVHKMMPSEVLLRFWNFLREANFEAPIWGPQYVARISKHVKRAFNVNIVKIFICGFKPHLGHYGFTECSN